MTPITAVRYKVRALRLRVGLNAAVWELYGCSTARIKCLNKDELTGLERDVLLSVMT